MVHENYFLVAAGDDFYETNKPGIPLGCPTEQVLVKL